MTKTTLELAPSSPNFRTTPTGGRLDLSHDLTCNIHGGSTVESSFEPGALVPEAVTLPLEIRVCEEQSVKSFGNWGTTEEFSAGPSIPNSGLLCRVSKSHTPKEDV
ncbi:hypothetical protein AVEN_226104-1 [Araneus ventricosus]|uniref:Uncharacterized protein n=1 Tax=Araneus ventricosus TaxID=182803 RepID=A0A4Y2VSB4_ARAVE|nr:hypothetical protein AVEN_122729-1 [Araneus ventricosus]GBO28176.1 hypothetical protein AVEN_213907-1 [Araneus ventricosus]GBO28293.1 hypothetical protein AVEN_226104-1 [Araneus ventricosus]